MQNINQVLKIKEYMHDYDKLDLFFKRYHASETFFSIRNMGSQVKISNIKNLNRHQANLRI